MNDVKPEKMDDEEFNRLLNGPLAHPFPIFAIQRLAMALRIVVEAGGPDAARALRSYCEQRQKRDDNPGDHSEDG